MNVCVQGRLVLNDEVEADTAEAVGLPAFEVSEAELPFLPPQCAPVRSPTPPYDRDVDRVADTVPPAAAPGLPCRWRPT